MHLHTAESRQSQTSPPAGSVQGLRPVQRAAETLVRNPRLAFSHHFDILSWTLLHKHRNLCCCQLGGVRSWRGDSAVRLGHEQELRPPRIRGMSKLHARSITASASSSNETHSRPRHHPQQSLESTQGEQYGAKQSVLYLLADPRYNAATGVSLL